MCFRHDPFPQIKIKPVDGITNRELPDEAANLVSSNVSFQRQSEELRSVSLYTALKSAQDAHPDRDAHTVSAEPQHR